MNLSGQDLSTMGHSIMSAGLTYYRYSELKVHYGVNNFKLFNFLSHHYFPLALIKRCFIKIINNNLSIIIVIMQANDDKFLHM